MGVLKLDNICAFLAFVSFLLAVGSVGALENGMIDLWCGTGQAVLFLLLVYIFAWLCEKCGDADE